MLYILILMGETITLFRKQPKSSSLERIKDLLKRYQKNISVQEDYVGKWHVYLLLTSGNKISLV